MEPLTKHILMMVCILCLSGSPDSVWPLPITSEPLANNPEHLTWDAYLILDAKPSYRQHKYDNDGAGGVEMSAKVPKSIFITPNFNGSSKTCNPGYQHDPRTNKCHQINIPVNQQDLLTMQALQAFIGGGNKNNAAGVTLASQLQLQQQETDNIDDSTYNDSVEYDYDDDSYGGGPTGPYHVPLTLSFGSSQFRETTAAFTTADSRFDVTTTAVPRTMTGGATIDGQSTTRAVTVDETSASTTPETTTSIEQPFRGTNDGEGHTDDVINANVNQKGADYDTAVAFSTTAKLWSADDQPHATTADPTVAMVDDSPVVATPVDVVVNGALNDIDGLPKRSMTTRAVVQPLPSTTEMNVAHRTAEPVSASTDAAAATTSSAATSTVSDDQTTAVTSSITKDSAHPHRSDDNVDAGTTETADTTTKTTQTATMTTATSTIDIFDDKFDGATSEVDSDANDEIANNDIIEHNAATAIDDEIRQELLLLEDNVERTSTTTNDIDDAASASTTTTSTTTQQTYDGRGDRDDQYESVSSNTLAGPNSSTTSPTQTKAIVVVYPSTTETHQTAVTETTMAGNDVMIVTPESNISTPESTTSKTMESPAQTMISGPTPMTSANVVLTTSAHSDADATASTVTAVIKHLQDTVHQHELNEDVRQNMDGFNRFVYAHIQSAPAELEPTTANPITTGAEPPPSVSPTSLPTTTTTTTTDSNAARRNLIEHLRLINRQADETRRRVKFPGTSSGIVDGQTTADDPAYRVPQMPPQPPSIFVNRRMNGASTAFRFPSAPASTTFAAADQRLPTPTSASSSLLTWLPANWRVASATSNNSSNNRKAMNFWAGMPLIRDPTLRRTMETTDRATRANSKSPTERLFSRPETKHHHHRHQQQPEPIADVDSDNNGDDNDNVFRVLTTKNARYHNR